MKTEYESSPENESNAICYNNLFGSMLDAIFKLMFSQNETEGEGKDVSDLSLIER